MSSAFSRAWNRLRTSPLRRLYDRLPGGLRSAYRFATSYPSWLAWRWSPYGYRRSLPILGSLHDRFEGCRAVVMGNGPSLARTDWSLLEEEFLIGTNRVYLLGEALGRELDAYVCVNELVLSQFHEEIKAVDALKLIDWRAGRRFLAGESGVVFVPERPSLRFHTNLLSGWNLGYTVTYAALQLAFHLGFSKVILIGVDHRFQATGPPMREVTSESLDRDHFSTGYFGPGVRWHLPNLAGSERFYRTARAVFETHGRSLVDATEDGALEVFTKQNLDEALKDRAFHPPSRGAVRTALQGPPKIDR